jgi:hypothetical protein
MPLVEVSEPVLFVYVPPAAGPLTRTENEHIQLTGRLAPERLIVFPPLVVSVPPLQTLVELSATLSPAGNVSVKPSPSRSLLFVSGLLSVKVSVDVPLAGMLAGLKAIEMVGAQPTVMLAVADPSVPPSFELMAPVVLV